MRELMAFVFFELLVIRVCRCSHNALSVRDVIYSVFM